MTTKVQKLEARARKVEAEYRSTRSALMVAAVAGHHAFMDAMRADRATFEALLEARQRVFDAQLKALQYSRKGK